ncbi:MAG TPA: GNAT family N-acetyltransferase [Anaerolineae bacterium]|nr:GNAT family N-acetyltransferase [Anaerolineae bacterium]
MSKPNWILRNYVTDSDADLFRLLRLCNEVEAYDCDPNPSSEADLRAQLKWQGHDPARDRWVVASPDDPDHVIGYGRVFAQSSERTVVWILVHPAWRRQKIGMLLLQRALERAREQGAMHVTSTAMAEDVIATAFLTCHHFSAAGDNWSLLAPQDLPFQAPCWPTGYTVRTYAEVQHLPTLVEVLNRCYSDMWGHRENTPGAVNEQYLSEAMIRRPEIYIPEGMFIVFAPDGSVAGFCRAEFEAHGTKKLKIVDGPGVVPEHRPQRLQRPLALTAMQWLNAQQAGPVTLYAWGDSEKTVEIYREMGFILQEHWIEYKRDLKPD